jgi:hypothetical protein
LWLALYEGLTNCDCSSIEGTQIGFKLDKEIICYEQVKLDLNDENMNKTKSIQSRVIEGDFILLSKKIRWNVARDWYMKNIGVKYHYFGINKKHILSNTLSTIEKIDIEDFDLNDFI